MNSICTVEMPALIEASGERRPRRSSITSQLHRMFHKDKVGETKRSVYESSFPDNQSPSMRRADSGSFDYANYGPSEVSSNGYSHNSPSSLNSKVTGMNTSESRHSSIQSFQLDQQATESPTFDSLLGKSDFDRSSTVSHGPVQKKDRRATKRLEAERLELEKRMLKLEEAERINDSSLLRRESRRLTKKQPLESVSRSSSVSADEPRSRPPSRLSSIFSSSRRRSRSRASSTDGMDDAQSSQEAPSNNPNALPALSSTLPERLSTAISKELAARKDALLVSPVESSLPLRVPNMRNGPDYGMYSQSTVRAREDAAYHATGASMSDDIQSVPNGADPAKATEDTSHKSADLDRSLFTASLSSKKKSAAPSGRTSKTVQTGYSKAGSETGRSEAHSLTDDDQAQIRPRHRSKSPRKGLPRAMLVRASTDGVMERPQKKFISSPLAVSQTIAGDDALSAPRRASTLASFQTDTARSQVLAAIGTRPESNVMSSPAVLQASHENVKTTENTNSHLTVPLSVTGARNARVSSRGPATSQLAPQASLTKPRFYHSLNKVTGPSGGKPTATGTLSLNYQERNSSPPVPPKSPKRHSRTLSQSSGLSTEITPPPASGISAGQSPGSDSDYDTADETTSIMSRMSDDGDRPSTEIGTAGNTRARKRVSGSDKAIQPVVSSSKEDSKKATKAKQVGRNQLVAKLFVICCQCKHWHDMPSDVYASLTVSDPLSAALDQELAAWEQKTMTGKPIGSMTMSGLLGASSAKSTPTEAQIKLRTRIMAGLPSSPVKCCWCEHQMSSTCCQGWTTVVQMRQRHH